MQTARTALFEKHRAGGGGLEIAAAYSKMMDELICHLFAAISKDFCAVTRPAIRNARSSLRRGYGRSELNPHSDIDLLFIYSWKVSPFVEAVTEKLLYTLWDAGLQVGHAIRSISESMRLASTDMKVRTALLDSRYVCGDQTLYNEFEKAVRSRLARKRVSSLSAKARRKRRTPCRLRRFGLSVGTGRQGERGRGCRISIPRAGWRGSKCR